MSTQPPLAATLLLTISLLLLISTTTDAHNITRILAKHPSFSSFNHYLTVTHLAADINRRQTITVLALDNAAMSSLIAKGLPIYTLRNVLSLHVLVDYFGAKKLHQITDGTTLTSSMFQATGTATGTSGYVNITNLKGGKVGFGAEDNDGKLDSLYVKSVEEIPYNISILQISQALNSAEAEAPTAAPSLNLTTIMSKQGCQTFLDLLKATGALSTFEETVDGGLTVFCPTDGAVNGFMPKYKNLTAAKKVSLLLYHGIPVYYSLQMLKSNNGVMNTLATEGANKYDFTVQDDGEDVKLETKVVTATVTGTLKDEEPLIVYKIDKVLQPRELFKAVEAPEPAPAPKGAKKKKPAKKGKAAAVEADAPGPDGATDDYADDTTAADDNGVSKMDGGRLAMVFLSLCSVVILF
ncbi:fasciclin-like arabinogalactan protein 2 [Mercurialis annua]|uniref:fasciclin-like arabinogalactan protein 2 n=1 Tax=Mercurialis annua TaxID=3986 RepID=UPI00215ED747|nr:fasciclin-like arabinogalactan protein 2 [Mercurialis annua]